MAESKNSKVKFLVGGKSSSIDSLNNTEELNTPTTENGTKSSKVTSSTPNAHTPEIKGAKANLTR